MKIKMDNYMCTKCFTPKAFNPENQELQHKCPNCNNEMEFWCSEEMNTETGRTIQEEKTSNDNIDIKKIVTGISTITCPYCQSSNTKKISTTSKAVNTAMFGLLGTKRHKQWHCNNCNSDF